MPMFAECRDEAVCGELWGPDTNGCNTHLQACVGRLTIDQQRQWQVAVRRCVQTTTTCSQRFTCYAAVPWC